MRIAKEKELLTKEKAQLIVDLTASERENRMQSEVCDDVVFKTRTGLRVCVSR